MDVVDGLGKEPGYGKNLNFIAPVYLVPDGDGISDQNLGKIRGMQAFDRRPGKHRMGCTGENLARAVFQKHMSGGDHGACRVDHVVDNHGALPFDIADDMHSRGLIWFVAALVDDGQTGPDALGVGTCTFHSARIRRYHDHVLSRLTYMIQQDRLREQVIDRDIKEPLNLPGVKVNRDQAVHAGGLQKVRDHFRADRSSGADLSILPGVTVVGNNSGYPSRARSFKRVEHEAELNEIEVNRRAGGLNDKNVISPHIIADFNTDFAVTECFTEGGRKSASEMIADGLGQ